MKMKTVGVYEAKTHLPRLLEEVERGETITITRHGKPVARLEGVARPRARSNSQLKEAFRELRAAQEPGGPSIRELIEEGRRY